MCKIMEAINENEEAAFAKFAEEVSRLHNMFGEDLIELLADNAKGLKASFVSYRSETPDIYALEEIGKLAIVSLANNHANDGGICVLNDENVYVLPETN